MYYCCLSAPASPGCDDHDPARDGLHDSVTNTKFRFNEIMVNMYASNTADRIPWHSDGQPLFGEEAFAAYPTDP